MKRCGGPSTLVGSIETCGEVLSGDVVLLKVDQEEERIWSSQVVTLDLETSGPNFIYSTLDVLVE